MQVSVAGRKWNVCVPQMTGVYCLCAGQIWTRGPHTLLRYWGHPDARDANGWFCTGDLGVPDEVASKYQSVRSRTFASCNHDSWLFVINDVITSLFVLPPLGYIDGSGFLWLLGRCKDVIRTGGENVHASEVESVLEAFPSVVQAAGGGIPNARLGEQVL